MKRPLRSLLIGDVDFYPSELVFGVAQGMTMLGHWHRSVNIRLPIDVIKQVVRQVRPDIVWGHMLLWPPGTDAKACAKKAFDLLALCAGLRTLYDTKVVMHDGDARPNTRFPFEIAGAIDLALCNHSQPRSEWGIPQERWPYFAFVQKEPAEPVDEFKCDLAFAGRLGDGVYTHRTEMVNALARILGDRFKLFAGGDQHTLFRTPELATSAVSILGYARPDAPGWTDVRVFQYPGAGGVLLHDDVNGFLQPMRHYVPYETGNLDSIIDAIDIARLNGDYIRREAFRYIQAHHSSLSRVKEVLAWLNLK